VALSNNLNPSNIVPFTPVNVISVLVDSLLNVVGSYCVIPNRYISGLLMIVVLRLLALSDTISSGTLFIYDSFV